MYECQNCGRIMDTADGYAEGLCDHCYNKMSENGSLDPWLLARDADYVDYNDILDQVDTELPF